MTRRARDWPEAESCPCLVLIDLATGSLAVHGDLDRTSVHHLLDAAAALPASPSASWSVDVSRVTFCDAAGLRALLAVRRLADAEGRSFTLARPGSWLRRLLSLAGLDAAAGALPACAGRAAVLSDVDGGPPVPRLPG